MGKKNQLIIFRILYIIHSFCSDPLNTHEEEDNDRIPTKSDLSTSDYHSYLTMMTETSIRRDESPFEFFSTNKKMCDITELLGPSSSFDDKEEICYWFDKLHPISTSSPSSNIVEYLCAQKLKDDQDIQWEIEQNHLKYGI